MRSIITIALSLLFVSTAYAQDDPKSYLSRIPALPNNVCSMSDSEREKYLEKVDKIYQELLSKIEAKEESSQKNNEQGLETIKKDMENKMKQDYGLSATDIQNMENDDLSDEEREAIGNKMLQQKYNVSINDLKNVSEMSENEQQAWIESYAGKQTADVQNHKEATIDAENKKNMNMAELQKEQISLNNQLTVFASKYDNKLKDLEKKESAAKIELKNELDKILKALFKQYPGAGGGEEGGGINEEDRKRDAIYEEKREKLQQQHCNEFSLSYYNIVKEKISELPAQLPLIKRFVEISNQLYQSQLDTKIEITPSGLQELKAIEGCVALQIDIFKYCSVNISY